MDIITFNCGGKTFQTRKSTIFNYPESLLAKKITTHMQHDYFIDRNSDLFSIVLDFYRTGTIYQEITQEIQDEFDYFNLEIPNLTKIDKNKFWFNTNENIQNAIKIIDKLFESDFFNNILKKETTFTLGIGPPVENYEHYKCFFDKKIKDLLSFYIKHHYNLLNNFKIKASYNTNDRTFRYFDKNFTNLKQITITSIEQALNRPSNACFYILYIEFEMKFENIL